MYIKVDDTEYTTIKNLSFAPSVDLIGASIPINELQVDVVTDDEFGLADVVELYNDRDNPWAKYGVAKVDRVDAHTVRLRAQDDVAMLDKVRLPAVYHNSILVPDLLDDTIVTEYEGLTAPWPYYLDPTFNNAVVHGFFPEQSARERLLWVCFTIGAYVKTCFNDELQILAIDSTESMIPMGDTYWKPTLVFKDPVTSIRVKEYDFAQGTPTTTDKYVTDENGTVYIVTETESVLYNPDVPAGALPNEVTIEGVYTITPNNSSGILSRISGWYFSRNEVDFEAIDNAAYVPGDKVAMYADESTMKSGYIDSAAFTFGLQAKAKLHMTAAVTKPTGTLTITYLWNGIQVDQRYYLFPVGYEWSVTNPYLEITMNGHYYVLRPVNATASGTIASGTNTNSQNTEEALDLYEGDLHLISVDGITDNDGVGVIS